MIAGSRYDNAGFPTPDHLTALSPLSYLERSAHVYRDRPAVVDGDLLLSYADLHARTQALAGFLVGGGIGRGDRVAVLAPNTHLLLEAHFGVPAAGAVLVAMNSRLATGELAYILEHSGAKLLLVDDSLAALGEAAAAGTGVRVVHTGESGSEYERLLEGATPYWSTPADEMEPLSLNYTSGTTGTPKGVVYHHRGAFLQALAMAYHTRLGSRSVYLWTLPMFHTNGWCFPWAVTAAGALHVCLHRIDPALVWRLLREQGVTHMCAAPTVLIMLAEHPAAAGGVAQPIKVLTGGAPPTPALLERFGELGIEVTHLYGLTETFGPVALCDWNPEWDDVPISEQARLKARQGVGGIASQRVRVVDADGKDVPADGASIGEVAVTGNNVMSGYYRDEEATRRAIPDGWFRTGDLAVQHPDGYVEIRDRKKDLIISGGENISSVEVERVLATHPAVYEASVIGVPDDKWGELPVAVVELRQGTEATAAELIQYVRARIAHFKAPRQVLLESLPRTSTGKVQKHLLRKHWAGEGRFPAPPAATDSVRSPEA